MREIKSFGLILVLVSITACAPVVYDATYRVPAGHVSVHTTYMQPSYRYKTTHHHVDPIEVTLYAGNSYVGAYFKPIRIVIADNQYVEIPAKDKRGRHTKLYAHYHKKNLHFDTNRNCQGIHGASRYSYDSRWDKGHKYAYINAGKNYDLRGLRLQIRNAPNGRHQFVSNAPVKIVNKTVNVHQKTIKVPAKQPVAVVQPKSKVKKLVQKQNNSIRGYFKNGQGNVPKMQRIKGKVTRRVPEKIAKTIKRSVVVSAPSKDKSKKIVVQEQNNSSRRYFKSQHSNNNKVTTVKEKETRRAPEKVVKRPDIVEKINQERKSQRLSVRAVMSVNTSKR